MNDSQRNAPHSSGIAQAAAEWTLRLDHGLTASEQDAYIQWLSEDPRHRQAMAECQWGWNEFDRLAGLQTTRHAHVDPDLLKPTASSRRFSLARRRWRPWLVFIPIAAASVLALFMVWNSQRAPVLPVVVRPLENLPPRIEVVRLPEGSRVQLNHGAAIETSFTREERRVHLVSGEASFEVTHDPSRPFIVDGGGVRVRAVGTAFNVRLNSSTVEVIVTEGKVQVGTGTDAAIPAELPLVESGQLGIVNLEAMVGEPSIQISTIKPAEIARELAWQPRLLDFNATPLPTIVASFNRANRVKLIVGDPKLNDVVLSCAFWSDNVQGFVRLMESSFGLQAEWRGSDAIVLRHAGFDAPSPQ